MCKGPHLTLLQKLSRFLQKLSGHGFSDWLLENMTMYEAKKPFENAPKLKR